MRGCSGGLFGRETPERRLVETHRFRQGGDWLLHVASSLGSTMCRQPIRRCHRKLLATFVHTAPRIALLVD